MTQLPQTPEAFIRAFGAAWGARDVDALTGLMTEDADFLGLTGGLAEGRKATRALLEAELAGTFARSRLVTGKTRLRGLGDGAVVVHQRFVLSGLIDAGGQDMGRIGAVLIAVLVTDGQGWQAVSAQFTGLEA